MSKKDFFKGLAKGLVKAAGFLVEHPELIQMAQAIKKGKK